MNDLTNKEVRINLKKTVDHSYSIFIASGILREIPSYLKTQSLAHTYAIITDSNVEKIYGRTLLEDLQDHNLKTYLLNFPAGEFHKNRDTKAMLEDEMFKLNLGRDTAIIALGGGVVGDMAGFVASTYNRGIPYVQVPTTLLAQVDSSIGGKTGLDVPWGKNLIGTFYQPHAVFIDVDSLETLPKKEFISGMAEVIKHSLIKDEEFFSFLEENWKNILDLDRNLLVKMIQRNCKIKGEVIEADEREGNLRKILNYGHTIGHALETYSNYTYLHGEAVATGIIVEGTIASLLGFFPIFSLERQQRLLEVIGLPQSVPKRINLKKIIEFTRMDKKVRKGIVEYILPDRIGRIMQIEGKYGLKVKDEVVLKALEKCSSPLS